MAYEFQSTLAAEFKNFLQMIEAAGEQTRGYEVTFKSLDIYLEEISFEEKALPETVVLQWLDSMSCKPQTKNRKITHVRVFARYLSALEISSYEPEYLKEHSNFIPYTFSDEEFQAIMKAADGFKGNIRMDTKTSYVFPMLLRILYGCGLRLGETISLRWENVDLESGILHIKKAKNDKDRDVPVDPSLKKLLARYKDRIYAENPNTDYLFESDRKPGTPYLGWTFRRWFLCIVEEAGILNERPGKFEHGISPHTLRHYFTYKSFLQSEEKGRSLEQFAPYLSAYLGHKSLLETEKYLSTDYTLYQKSQQKMAEAINHVFPEVDFE